MPKQFYAKKSKPFKRGSLRSKTTLPTKAAVHKEIVKEIAMNMELKEFDTVITTAANPNTTGTVVHLNPIVTGTDVTNRIARRVNVKAVDVMYSWRQNAAGAGGQIALVYDNQPDGTVPGYNVIFDTSVGGAGMAFKNTVQNAKRFKIFWLDTQPTFGQSADPTVFMEKRRHYVKVPEACQPCQFGSSAGTVPNTGGWYLCYGDSTNVAANVFLIYNVKLQFTDG